MKYRVSISGPGWSRIWVIHARHLREAISDVANTVDTILSTPQQREARERELAAMVRIQDDRFEIVQQGAITEFASELVTGAAK